MAIRALGWATKVLWIILIVIIVTMGYSATQINVSLDEPTTAVTAQDVMISLPINIRNMGFYDLTQFNLTTRITDQNGDTLANDTSLTSTIPRGTSTTDVHTIKLNITRILTAHRDLLTNDTTFTTYQSVAFNYADAIPLDIRANQTMPWGAPLNHLTVKRVTPERFNATHTAAKVELYFENHNQFMPVAGTVGVEVYDNHQNLEGTGRTSLNTDPNSTYDGQITILIRNSDILRTPASALSGKVHVFFETSTFTYGPVSFDYGSAEAVSYG